MSTPRPKHLVDDLSRSGCANVRAPIELARQALGFIDSGERALQLLHIVLPAQAGESFAGAAELRPCVLEVSARLAEVEIIEIEPGGED